MAEDHRFREANDYSLALGLRAGIPTYVASQMGAQTAMDVVFLSSSEADWHDVPRTDYGVFHIEDVPALFRAANSWAVQNSFPAAFPNCHQGIASGIVVYGTITLKPATVEFRDVPRTELGVFHIEDVPGMMSAADRWAIRHGFSAGFPTFNQADYGKGVVCGLMLLEPGVGKRRKVALSLLDLYSIPPPSWAVLLCHYHDQSPPVAAAQQTYLQYFTSVGDGSGGAYDYWRDMSYRLGGLLRSSTFGWFDLGHNVAEATAIVGPAQRNQVIAWARAAAQAAGHDLSSFDHVLVVVGGPNAGGTDHGFGTGGVLIVAPEGLAWQTTFVGHEEGHELGLDHSFGESSSPCALGDIRPGAYCDTFDIMSAMNVFAFTDSKMRLSGPALNAASRRNCGWLHDSRVWHQPSGHFAQAISLAPLDAPVADGFLMAQFAGRTRESGSAAISTYTLEYRRKTGWDAGLPFDSILIHEIRADGLVRLLTKFNELVPGAAGTLINGTDFSTPDGGVIVRLIRFDAASETAIVEIFNAVTRPFWIADFNDDGRDELVFYDPVDDNWWIGTVTLGTVTWSLAGNTAGFGHAINDGRPFWTGDFNGDGKAEILFYYPGDDNWWLGIFTGLSLTWSLAGNTAGFGHAINDGRPFWIGRFERADRDSILFYYPGDDNWWVGTLTGVTIGWSLAGNTVGLGHRINDGRPFWVGRFVRPDLDSVLFYYPGDDNWWVGTLTGGSIGWSLAGNTAGFGHAINDGRPFWVGDFDGNGRSDVLFYYPGDDNWWLGTFIGSSLTWSLAGNTARFGHRINDGRPFWIGRFERADRDSVLFYYPGDDNWWVGTWLGRDFEWEWAGNTAGFGHGINDGRPFLVGRFGTNECDDILFYYPGDNNWWLGSHQKLGGQFAWSLAGNSGGLLVAGWWAG